MGNKKNQFEVQMKFDDDTIRRMFRAEYYTYENLQRLMRFILGTLGILTAVFLNLPAAGRAFLLLAGVWLLVAGDFPSKVRAEGVIEKRGGKSSWVSYQFGDTGIQISGGGFIPYKTLDKQLFDETYLYLFVDRQLGLMLPIDDIKPADPERLKTLVSGQSGKGWKRLTAGVWNYNLRDVIEMMDNRKKCKSNS